MKNTLAALAALADVAKHLLEGRPNMATLRALNDVPAYADIEDEPTAAMLRAAQRGRASLVRRLRPPISSSDVVLAAVLRDFVSRRTEFLRVNAPDPRGDAPANIR